MSLQTSKSSIAFHWNLQNRFIVRLFRNFGLFRRYHSFKKKKSVNSFKKWSPYRLNNVHRNTSWSTKFNVGDGVTSCFFHTNKQRHFFFLLMFISFVLSWLEENQRSCHCVCFLELISYYYLVVVISLWENHINASLSSCTADSLSPYNTRYYVKGSLMLVIFS